MMNLGFRNSPIQPFLYAPTGQYYAVNPLAFHGRNGRSGQGVSFVTNYFNVQDYLCAMKFLKQNWLLFLGVLLGALGGYIYWHFWGCMEGCAIRSVWWRMTLWGAAMGGLSFSIIVDFLRKKSARN